VELVTVVKACAEVFNGSKQNSHLLNNENYKGKCIRITGEAGECGEGMRRGD
jgi:hypothetical protein